MKHQGRGLIHARFRSVDLRQNALKDNAEVRVFVRVIRSLQIWTVQTVAEDESGNIVTFYRVTVPAAGVECVGHRNIEPLTYVAQ